MQKWGAAIAAELADWNPYTGRYRLQRLNAVAGRVQSDTKADGFENAPIPEDLRVPARLFRLWHIGCSFAGITPASKRNS